MGHKLRIFWRVIKSLFSKEQEPPKAPEPKPPYVVEDEQCDAHSCRFEDPADPVEEYVPDKYKGQYLNLYLSMQRKLLGKQANSTIVWTVNHIKKGESTYKRSAEYVRAKLGSNVPWELVAAFHMKEASGDFKKQILNGQPITQKTTWIPRGFGPWKTWEDSCVDAFRIKDLPKKWTIENTLYFAERYNGLGYRTKTRSAIVGFTPYLWSYTNHYKGGYFVSDGKFSNSAVAMGVGVAVILKELGFQGEQ